MCGTTALVIGVVRGLTPAPSLNGHILNDLVYALWFLLAAVGLLATADRPWLTWSRVVAALASGAFVMLGMDVIGRSITSGVIPFIFAYRLGWEALRCKI